MPRKRLAGLMLVIACVVPALALAAIPRPRAGKWKIAGGGSFTVSKNRKSVSGLRISGAGCNLGKLAVAGTQTLRLVSAGGYSNWIVGFNDPKRTNPNDLHGVVGQRVLIHSGGKTLHARLDIVFAVAGYAKDNSGDLLISGCDLNFAASAP
jgi:hypothetical protein